MFHIVTLFPELLNYSFYAPLILRVVLAMFAFSFGFSAKNVLDNTADPSEPGSKKDVNYFVKALFVVAGVLILAGFYTQLAAMALTALFIVALAKRELVIMEKVGRSELILLIAISIALIILPAGYFAIDYPL